MNQIPNIEETDTKEGIEAWKDINRLEGECAECGGTGEGADNPCSDHGGTYPCYVCNGTGLWSVYRKKDVDKFLHQQLQKARYCGEELPDGSICGCKLDCHLHDWRQRDEIQKAREEALREIIEVRNDRNKSTRELLDTIDKYHSELDQYKK